MFDIDRGPLGASIRCRDCRAKLTIDSDYQPMIKRAIADYVKQHRCPAEEANTRRTEGGVGDRRKV